MKIDEFKKKSIQLKRRITYLLKDLNEVNNFMIGLNVKIDDLHDRHTRIVNDLRNLVDESGYDKDC